MGNKLSVSNEIIMDAVRSNASDAYQARIPEATVGGIKQAMAALDKYQPQWNEFMEVFLNSIAADYFEHYEFSNPLAKFERTAGNGSTIRESSVELVKAHNYSKLGADVFHGQVPKINVHYHYQTRKDQYDLEVNREILSQAMGVDGGLMQLLVDYGNSMNRSNEVDTYLVERGTIGEYFAHNNADVWNVNVPNILTATDKEAAGKEIAFQLTTIQGKMAFPTSATDFIPNHNVGNARETVLWVTPEVEAAFRTFVLPYAFHNGNLELGEMANTVQVIDVWPQGVPEGTQCILADSKWTVWATTKKWSDYIHNPRNSSDIYYLNIWGIYSCSRMVPVVRFSTDATSTSATASPTYTGLTLTGVKNAEGESATPTGSDGAYTTTVKAIRGTDTWLTWAVAGTNRPNQACLVELSGNTSSNTFVDNNGKLFVATEETATSLVIKFTSVFSSALTAQLTVSVADAE